MVSQGLENGGIFSVSVSETSVIRYSEQGISEALRNGGVGPGPWEGPWDRGPLSCTLLLGLREAPTS